MVAQHNVDPDDDSAVSEHIYRIVTQCQSLHQRWVETVNAVEKAALWAAYNAQFEKLWSLLVEHFIRVARSWPYRSTGDDDLSVALGMAALLYLKLPSLRLDPEQNVLHYLLMAARNGLYSELRIETEWARALRRKLQDQTFDDDTHGDGGFEQQLLNALHNQQVLAAVLAYWERHLSPEDKRIMERRYGADRLRPFRAIAEQMGSGWTDETVRQRHKRALDKTREELRRYGLLD